MGKLKQRTLKEVAKEILQKYKEHEEKFIKITSKSIEEQDLRLGFLRVNVEMYANEIERASALEAPKRGHWKYIRRDEGSTDALYCCSVCGAGDEHNDAVQVPYCWKCGARMDAERKEE